MEFFCGGDGKQNSSYRSGSCKDSRAGASISGAPSVLAEISIKEEDRISTGIGELDRVLGGGIVQGSLTLVGETPESGNRRYFYRYAAIFRQTDTRYSTYRGRNPLPR